MTADTLTVALATPGDAPAVARLQRLAPGAGWTKSELAGLLAEPGVAAPAAWRDGEMAAFLLCRRAADEAEVLSVAVEPQERRRGLALRLIAAAITWARAGGAAHLFLEVAADNAPALALYSKAGFVRVGDRKGYYGPGADALVMRLDLNS